MPNKALKIVRFVYWELNSYVFRPFNCRVRYFNKIGMNPNYKKYTLFEIYPRFNKV